MLKSLMLAVACAYINPPGLQPNAPVVQATVPEILKQTYGHLEKFFSPSRYESDSLTAMGHGRMERASHGADGLFRC